MWICLSDGFVSIVQVHDDPDRLLVRARKREHLEAFDPEFASKIEESPFRDYRFRIRVRRTVVADVLTRRVFGLQYSNFKDSVEDKDLKRMYTRWWGDHHTMQFNALSEELKEKPVVETARKKSRR
jgi:hypothetical protein